MEEVTNFLNEIDSLSSYSLDETLKDIFDLKEPAPPPPAPPIEEKKTASFPTKWVVGALIVGLLVGSIGGFLYGNRTREELAKIYKLLEPHYPANEVIEPLKEEEEPESLTPTKFT